VGFQRARILRREADFNVSRQPRIDDGMFDPLALPCVGDVDQAVLSLDYRRVGILAWLRFQNQRWLPLAAITGDGQIQRRAALGGVVVGEERARVFERDGVDAAVGVGKACGPHGAPGLAAVFGPAFGDVLLSAPAY